MHNIPSAVWIDEAGRIVHTAEPLGPLDTIRQMDPKTREIPAPLRAERERRREHYYNAIRDWADCGEACTYALTAAAVRQRIPTPTEDHALAVAHFRLGEYLHQQGRDDETQNAFEMAATLHPEDWTIRRQSWDVATAQGASRPALMAVLDKLGDTPFYEPTRMPGLD